MTQSETIEEYSSITWYGTCKEIYHIKLLFYTFVDTLFWKKRKPDNNLVKTDKIMINSNDQF